MNMMICKIQLFTLKQKELLLKKLRDNAGAGDDHVNWLGYAIVGVMLVGLVYGAMKLLFPQIIDSISAKIMELFN